MSNTTCKNITYNDDEIRITLERGRVALQFLNCCLGHGKKSLSIQTRKALCTIRESLRRHQRAIKSLLPIIAARDVPAQALRAYVDLRDYSADVVVALVSIIEDETGVKVAITGRITDDQNPAALDGPAGRVAVTGEITDDQNK